MPIPVGPPPKKLVVVDLKKGSGRAARKGDELRVRYFNLAYRGHQIYEDNWDTTFGPFELGAGQVVESWDEGLPGIKAGTRRVLIVPGGRETFTREPEIYVVEAVSVVPSKHPTVAVQVTEKVKPTGAKPAIADNLGPPPTKLVVRTLKSGEGHRVRRGERLGVRFMDVSYRTRNTQDFWGEKGDEEPPYHFILGKGRVRKGWEIAIPGKRLGTRLELLLPSRLAYGEGPMRYVVELIDRTEPSPNHAE